MMFIAININHQINVNCDKVSESKKDGNIMKNTPKIIKIAGNVGEIYWNSFM